MRFFLILTLALTAAPASAFDWWNQSALGMREYVDQGYQVVGFSVIPESSRVMPLTSFRYVLQKGPAVATCTEKRSATTGDLVQAFCFDLK